MTTLHPCELGIPSLQTTEVGTFESRDVVALGQTKAKLGALAARSTIWRMGASGSIAIIRLSVLAILARELSPGVFGIMAMSTLVTGFAVATLETGFGSALVQRTHLTSAHLWWVFKLNLVLSIALWVICMVGAPLLGRFFGEPQVGAILAVNAAIFPLSAISLAPRALLMRHLEFRKLALCEVGEAITNGGVSVALALAGLGVWSLVAGALAGGGVSAALLLVFSPWRPARAGNVDDRGGLLRFAFAVILVAVLFYWTERIDNLVVARLLGAVPLGLYVVAFNLAIVVAGQLSVGTRVVAFPTFSALQDEPIRLAATYRRWVRWSAVLAFPCCSLTAALAPELIAVLLGPQWASCVPPFRLLLAVGAIRALYGFSGPALRARGKPNTELLLQAMLCIGVAIAAFLGARAGVVGVAAAVTIFMCLMGGPLFISIARPVTGVGVMGVFESAWAPGIAAGLAGAVALGARNTLLILVPDLPTLLVLSAAALIGLVSYVFATHLTAPDLFTEAYHLIWRKR